MIAEIVFILYFNTFGMGASSTKPLKRRTVLWKQAINATKPNFGKQFT